MRRCSTLALGLVISALLPATPAWAYRTAGEASGLGSAAVGWRTPNGRVPYRLHRSGAPGVPLSSVRDVAELAFREWSEVACVAIDFENAGISSARARPDDGANDIYWVRETGLWAELGLAEGALAVTDVTYERQESGAWEITEADILLNGVDYRWSPAAGSPPLDTRSVRAVLTHEVGHFLGLSHVCDIGEDPGAPACDGLSNPEAHLMYPGYVGPLHYDRSEDDAAGACYLYACSEVGCPSGETCGIAGCAAECDGELCRPGEACGSGGCVVAPSCSGEGCGAACAGDADCPVAERCAAGRCVTNGGQSGDPCSQGSECASEHCTDDGYCADLCDAERPCGGRLTCSDETAVGECLPSAGVFGDECSSPLECASRLCVQRADGHRTLCTRACSDIAPCPAGHACSQVDGRPVCVPPPGGCSLAPGTDTPSSPLFLWLAIGSLLCLRRQRSQRSQDV